MTHRAARVCKGSWRCSPELRPPSGTGCGPPGPVAGGEVRGGCTGAGFSLPRPRNTRVAPSAFLSATPLTPYTLEFCSTYRNRTNRTSLGAQWLRICLPMQGTRVRALVWEDSTCRGATKPTSHNWKKPARSNEDPTQP